MIQYNNVKYNKFGAVTDLFQPLWFLFPINLIGEIATPVSMSLRLFGNVMAGTSLKCLNRKFYNILESCRNLICMHDFFPCNNRKDHYKSYHNKHSNQTSG